MWCPCIYLLVFLKKELIHNPLAYHNIFPWDLLITFFNIFLIIISASLLKPVSILITAGQRKRKKSSMVAIKMNKEFRNNLISNVHAYPLNICCVTTTSHFTYLLMGNQIRVWHTINTLTHKPADECAQVLAHYKHTNTQTSWWVYTSAVSTYISNHRKEHVTQWTYFCQLPPWTCPRYCRDNMRLRLRSPKTL